MNEQNEQILAGKVAIVTGATGERGRAIAFALARAGAALTLASRNLHDLQKTGEDIQSATGAAAYLYGLDITQEDEVDECFKKVAHRFGDISILVNCAAQSQVKDSLSVTKKDMQNLLLVNLTGTFFCCREAARIMSERKSESSPALSTAGNIINLICLDDDSGASYTAGFYASKTGVIGLTKALAKEWQSLYVNVNAVVAGASDGSLQEFNISSVSAEKDPQSFPKDIGLLCVYLASPAASSVTGKVIPVKFSE